MSKGLEALEELKLDNVNYFIENAKYKVIIRQELKRLEELEKAFKALSKDDEKAKKLLSLEIEKNRALDTIKNKRVDVNTLLDFKKRCVKDNYVIESYNAYVGNERALTQEEYDLLKEVLL